MSSYPPREDEVTKKFVHVQKIEQAIERDTNDFKELTEILGLDPKTDFAKGNLSEFELQNADLANADLNHSRLDQAYLQNADLSNTDLTGVNFSNCDLTDANLTGANLTNASFRNAILKGTKFDEKNIHVKNANFTHAQGLTSEIIEKLKLGGAYIDANEVISDAQLKVLVDTFCRQVRETNQWYEAWYKLLSVVDNLPKLTRNYQPSDRYSQNNFEKLLYHKLSKILRDEICQNFDSEETNYVHNFTEWINYKLRFSEQPEEQLKDSNPQRKSLEQYPQDSIEDNEQAETLISIDTLIAKAQEKRPSQND